jgi:predicted dehydrogenase
METSQDSVIRIALLGADDTTPALVEAIGASDRFELAGVCELEGGSDPQNTHALRALIGPVRSLEVWEALLDSQAFDAVVVARGVDEDRRAEQLRKLIQVGMPLLVSHPVVDSMLVYYELDMIRRETGCVTVPHLSERHHPALGLLAEMVAQGADSPIGKIEQVVIDRCVASPSRAVVVRQFARDVDLVRGIAGDMTRLGALAGASGDSAYTSLGVQMSGPEGVVARWSVVPSRSNQGARITLVGAHGKALVEARPQNQPWTLELVTDGTSEERRYDTWDPAAASLDQLARAMQHEPRQPDWVDAARGVELAETIQRSLQKGRTIELYYEEYTEEGTFKGTMTSIGCGLLLLGMFLLGAVAIGEQMGLPLVRFWPYFLVGAFGLFLLLQLLMLVFRRPSAKSPEEILPETVESRVG